MQHTVPLLVFSKFAIQKSYAPCLGGSSMTGATAYMGGVGQSKHRAAKMATDIAQLKHSIAICFTKGPRLAPPCYLLSCWPPGARSGPHRPVTWLPWPTMLLEAQRSIQQNRRGQHEITLIRERARRVQHNSRAIPSKTDKVNSTSH